MKNTYLLLGAILLSRLANAQAYDNQVGTIPSRETLTDGILVDDFNSPSNEIGIAVGITNVNGYDQVLVTGFSNTYANVFYQQRHQITVPSGNVGKTRTVITSVKIANDRSTTDNTCIIAGSYYLSNTSQTIFYNYGIFTAILDETTGNISNLKRWESSVSFAGADGLKLAAANAGPGNKIYLTGDIHLQPGTSNRQFAMALNGTNNTLLWSTIIYDAGYPGLLIPADIIYSPYQPSGVSEVVIAGSSRPSNTADPKKAYLTRLNAATGAVVANTYIGDNTTFNYGVSAIIPSKSSGGVADGFLVCGNSPDVSGRNSAWVFKVNPACNSLVWNKEYNNLATNGEFTSCDIAESNIYLDPNNFFVGGTTYSTVAGTTYDAATIKIDANGSVLNFFSYVPPSPISGKNEFCGRIIPTNAYTNGICFFGSRVEPSNSTQSDFFIGRTLEDGLGCTTPANRTYQVRNLAQNVTSFTMTIAGNMLNPAISNAPAPFTGFTTHCYESLLVGGQQINGQTLRQADTETISAKGIYPNPASEYITVQFEQSEEPGVAPAVFSIIDINGRIVHETILRSTQTTIDLNGLSNGVYLYRIVRSSQPVDSGKLIITH